MYVGPGGPGPWVSVFNNSKEPKRILGELKGVKNEPSQVQMKPKIVTSEQYQ